MAGPTPTNAHISHFDAEYVLAAVVHCPRYMPLGSDALALIKEAVQRAWEELPPEVLAGDGDFLPAVLPCSTINAVEHALQWVQRALHWLPLARQEGFLEDCCETYLLTVEEEWLTMETHCRGLLWLGQ